MNLSCKRCGHEWMTRTDKEPGSCPKCRSPFWDKDLTPYWKMIRDKNKEAKKHGK